MDHTYYSQSSSGEIFGRGIRRRRRRKKRRFLKLFIILMLIVIWIAAYRTSGISQFIKKQASMKIKIADIGNAEQKEMIKIWKT